MIKIVLGDIDIFTLFKNRFPADPYIARIIMIYECYDVNDTTTDIWYQTIDKDAVVSLLARLDSQFIVFCTEKTDFNELTEFIQFFKFDSILSNYKIGLSEFDYALNNGQVLIHYREREDCNFKNIIKNTNLKDVCHFLINNGFKNELNTDSAAFYFDLSLKIRKNHSRAYMLYENNDYMACALTSAETKNCAVISAVAVHKKYRYNNFGTAIVTKMIADLKSENKNIFVYCNTEENLIFYNKLGFKKYDTWNEYYYKEKNFE